MTSDKNAKRGPVWSSSTNIVISMGTVKQLPSLKINDSWNYELPFQRNLLVNIDTEQKKSAEESSLLTQYKIRLSCLRKYTLTEQLILYPFLEYITEHKHNIT